MPYTELSAYHEVWRRWAEYHRQNTDSSSAAKRLDQVLIAMPYAVCMFQLEYLQEEDGTTIAVIPVEPADCTKSFCQMGRYEADTEHVDFCSDSF